ncbi:helix-turn-helix domain-containing protein [Acinetobacter pittii]|uniref:helix-turn-helix domain-containing protein n=1 Tax=Acinetobacter pittii TaxID=48296 RepID=UPI0009922FA9|nr:helix-turn-helix transcriptional regulator [Acinetobacter pittii]OOT52463.1 transcriptional regulator [Acinetobacter pittii]OTU66759.1 transcriptional regulator [Acinetobacter pittii]
MKLSALKKVRLANMMTQTAVAEAMGVSQPNYQRWESGAASIPKDKQAKLAKILNSTVDEILGNPRPFDNSGIHDEISDENTYFGEIAFHFRSGKGLLFPITEAERSRLHYRLNSKGDFIVVESLDNRIAFIRRASIQDVYLSSEAFDTFGPEKYKDWLGLDRIEDEEWLVIENIECLEYVTDLISEEKVKNYVKKILLTEEELDALIEQGHIKKEDREKVKRDASKKLKKLYARATEIQWQFANGKIRREPMLEDRKLYETFSCLGIDPEDADEIIYLPTEGYHRSIFINTSELDYIFIPAHKFNYGRLESLEEELDE